jgi:DNA-directed RNA polymerase subunit F
MSKGKSFRKVTQKLAGVISLKPDHVEELRLILETEQKRQVTDAEAKEFGQSLITVYKILAGDREILGVERRVEDGDSQ